MILPIGRDLPPVLPHRLLDVEHAEHARDREPHRVGGHEPPRADAPPEPERGHGRVAHGWVWGAVRTEEAVGAVC